MPDGRRQRIVDEFVRRVELLGADVDAVLVGLRVAFGRDDKGTIVSILPQPDRSTGPEGQRTTLTRILPVVVEVNHVITATLDGRAEWRRIETLLGRIVRIIETPPADYAVSGSVDPGQHWRRFDGLLTRSIERGIIGPTERVGSKETMGIGVQWECRYQSALGEL